MKEMQVSCAKREDRIAIESPALGIVSDLPFNGQILTPQSPVGCLQVLGTKAILRLPPEVQGKVVGADEESKVRPVEFGEILFSVAAFEPLRQGEAGQERSGEGSPVQGSCEILAQTHGIFYRRPSPDAPAYVEVGAKVRTGQVLGLVEVMKCFNQVLYSGMHLPPEAKVVEICVEDGAEIRFQQVLFRFQA